MESKRSYSVKIPVTGVIAYIMDADSPEEAINKALEDDDFDFSDIEELNKHRIICQGNVFNGELNEAEAEIIEPDEDEDDDYDEDEDVEDNEEEEDIEIS